MLLPTQIIFPKLKCHSRHVSCFAVSPILIIDDPSNFFKIWKIYFFWNINQSVKQSHLHVLSGCYRVF
jgi:hypothetical protein